MATTTNLQLWKGARGAADWDTYLNANMDTLDAQTVARAICPTDAVYGADPTGATSSTAAFRAAVIAAGTAGTAVLVPAGTFLLAEVDPGDTELILIDRPIKFIGMGMNGNTKFRIAASVPSTCDIIRVKPTTSGVEGGYTIADFWCEAVSGTPGQHFIHLDGTTLGAAGPQFVDIHRVGMGSDFIDGYSIYQDGLVATAWTVNVHITDSTLKSGINMVGVVSEGMKIAECYFPGTKAITITPQAGCGYIRVEDNIITTTGGIAISKCSGLRFSGNFYELYSNLLAASGVMVDIGQDSTVEEYGVEITHNGLSGGEYATTALRLKYLQSSIVWGNNFHAADAGADLHIQSDITNLTVGANGFGGANPIHNDITTGEVHFIGNTGTASAGGTAAAIDVKAPADGESAIIGRRKSASATAPILNLTDENGTMVFDIEPDGTPKFGKALIALGGGSAPTLGTIGGSGPATAGQNTWLECKDSSGNKFWLPVWK